MDGPSFKDFGYQDVIINLQIQTRRKEKILTTSKAMDEPV